MKNHWLQTGQSKWPDAYVPFDFGAVDWEIKTPELPEIKIPDNIQIPVDVKLPPIIFTCMTISDGVQFDSRA